MSITLSRPDLRALGERWRALEMRTDASVFQSWTWVGCQVAERFHDPLLLEATDGGETVALALFNRRGRKLWLHETGDPGLDTLFIERNGLLIAAGHEHLVPDLLKTLPHRLVFNGTDAALAGAVTAGRAIVSHVTRAAPVLDLTLPANESGSASARAQLRRAYRRFEAFGKLAVIRAGDAETARIMLAELIVHHERRWRGGGGAFADPRTLAFHHALLERGVPRGEADMLRVTAGERLVGLLYNLRRGRRVFAYQSGFDFESTRKEVAAAQLKPGLVCHAVAAEWYRAKGLGSYDFGAGDARYKRSLATLVDEMHWLELAPRWSAQAGLAAIRQVVRQFRREPSSTA